MLERKLRSMPRRIMTLGAMMVGTLGAGCGSGLGGGQPDAGLPFFTEAGLRAEGPPPSCSSCPSGFTCSGGVCRSASGVPHFSHVFIIYFENQDYSNIIGNTGSAPYINMLANQYSYLTNYSDVGHPSFPNYLALTAGSMLGMTSDCSPSSCPQTAAQIMSQLESAGKTWHAYAEDMPASCSTSDCGNYATRHNPIVYFTNMRASCAKNDLPYGASGANLTADLAKGGFDYTAIAPNLCDDMHNLCSFFNQVGQGDTWLMENAPLILGSSEWQNGGVLFLVWDEGSFDIGDQVAAIVASPLVKPGSQSGTKYNHYSLLATIQDGLGVPRLSNTVGVQPVNDIWK